MKRLALLGAVVACLVATSASGAGLYGEGYSGGYSCHDARRANYLLSLDFYTLREEVARRYYAAVDVFEEPSTRYSTTPLFEWANQTKIACAKAIGYLRRHYVWGPEVDVESIQKCECFYSRMVTYRGGQRTSGY